MSNVFRSILICALVTLAIPAFAMKPPKRLPPMQQAAQSTEVDSATEPVVKITPPPSYNAKRIALFPLELPGYVLKAVLWPIGAGLDFAKRQHADERVQNTLSFKSKQIWIYPVMDKSPGQSFGGGLAVKGINLFDEGYFFDADYRVHVNLDMFSNLSFTKKDLFRVGGLPFDLSFDGGWALRHSFNFFGVGNDSQEGDLAEWKEQDLDGNVKLRLMPIPTVGIYALFGGSATSTGEATNAGVNPAANPPTGYGRWLPYIRVGGGVEHDTLDVPWDPRRGGVERLEISRLQYMGSGQDVSYNDLRLTLLHYFPLWSPEHVIMLRNAWWLEQTGNPLPVPRMTILDADHMLRGFDVDRFCDRSSVVFNAEYYFPLFHGLRGMILADTGRVFNGFPNFTFKGFKYSAGGGLDFGMSRVITMRIRAAYGGEGVKFSFTLLRKQI